MLCACPCAACCAGVNNSCSSRVLTHSPDGPPDRRVPADAPMNLCSMKSTIVSLPSSVFATCVR
jgi:hypothetical protein